MAGMPLVGNQLRTVNDSYRRDLPFSGLRACGLPLIPCFASCGGSTGAWRFSIGESAINTGASSHSFTEEGI